MAQVLVFQGPHMRSLDDNSPAVNGGLSVAGVNACNAASPAFG